MEIFGDVSSYSGIAQLQKELELIELDDNEKIEERSKKKEISDAL